MSGDLLRGSFRRRIEGRLAEIRHRLMTEEACGKAVYGGAVYGRAASLPGFLELEEELLDEAAELERMLAVESAAEAADRAPRS